MRTTRYAIVSLFVFAVILTVTGRAEAQGVGVGIKGGVVFPDFRSADVNLDNRVGWQAGVFFGGDRTGKLGVQGEVNWLRTESAVALLTSGTAKATIDYVQIPVLARLNLGTKSKNKFAIYGILGPSFDIQVNENISGVSTATSDNFEKLNVSLMFGGGVEITRLIFEARYSWGFTQINKSFQSTSDVKLNSFALLFGLRFN